MKLLFKPGFTIKPIVKGKSLVALGLDEAAIWENGISIVEASNSKCRKYDAERMICMRTLLALIS